VTFKNPLSHKAIALLIVCSFLQFCVSLALAGPVTPSETALPTPPPQANGGRVITRNNQTVTVNGNVVGNGATVLPGAIVETGDKVAAAINLGPLGSIEIAPNTKIKIEFSNGQIKVTIIEGCAIVKNKQGVYAQVFTDKGQVASNDGIQKRAAVTDVCYPPGAPNAIVNQGAAANAGAGAAAVSSNIKKLELFGIFGGGGLAIALLAILNRGENPSPSQP
jgi:hypothetical protein